MRRLILLGCLIALLASGCSRSKDIAAATEKAHGMYPNPDCHFEVTKIDGPEYADVPKIPRDHIAQGWPDRSAACAVRVWYQWRDGKSVNSGDMLIWVGSDHKG